MAKKKSSASSEKNIPAVSAKPKNHFFTYLVIFAFGFLAGVAFTVYKSDGPVAVNQAESSDDGHNHENDDAILNLEAEVTTNPENHEAWTRLGHLYFDSSQPDKAIAAYKKSLELQPGNADVLTDLGVMYRRADQPSKAIEVFDKARSLDPNHMPSRFNKGIVLMYDLNDPAGAIESWEEVLKIDPGAKTGNGQSIRDFIDQIKADMVPEKSE